MDNGWKTFVFMLFIFFCGSGVVLCLDKIIFYGLSIDKHQILLTKDKCERDCMTSTARIDWSCVESCLRINKE